MPSHLYARTYERIRIKLYMPITAGMGYMSPVQSLPQNQQQQPNATFFPAFQ